MAPPIIQLDRLKSQLLTSGLQERNHALYQVINQLIDCVRQGFSEQAGLISSGGGGSSVTNIENNYLSVETGEGYEEPLIIPGPQGITGQDGLRGPAGFDGEDGLDNFMYRNPESGIFSAVVSIEYTPVLTNITLNDGTISGRYLRIGRFVIWNVILIWGPATTYGASPSVGLPFPAISGLNAAMSLYGSYTDTSAGASYFANLVAASASAILLTTFSGASALSSNTPLTNVIPFAWATTDVVRLSGVMIAAG
jgi:hypothetical protein